MTNTTTVAAALRNILSASSIAATVRAVRGCGVDVAVSDASTLRRAIEIAANAERHFGVPVTAYGPNGVCAQ